MNKLKNLPKIISTVTIILGSIDIIRGFMHTLLINFAATNIAGLDLSTSQAGDLLQLMGAFGISNYISGVEKLFYKKKTYPQIYCVILP